MAQRTTKRPDAALRCRAWNADRAHQRAAGQARAATGFTHEHQEAAGHCSFAAFSARYRASQGLRPLSGEWVRRYVTPDMIRLVARALSPEIQQRVWDAWVGGDPRGVVALLDAWALEANTAEGVLWPRETMVAVTETPRWQTEWTRPLPPVVQQ